MPDMMSTRGSCGGSCVCCPYGCTYTIPMLLALLGMIMTSMTTFSCEFFKTWTTIDSFGIEYQGSFSVGPWAVENFTLADGQIIKPDVAYYNDEVYYNNTDVKLCIGWNEHDVLDKGDLDAALVFARFATMFTWLGGVIFFIILLFAGCMPLTVGLLKFMSGLFLLFGVFMMLSLVAMSSDWCKDGEDCKLEWAGWCSIVGFFAWVGSGLTIWTMRERENGRISSVAQQSNTVEMTEQYPHAAASTTAQTEERTVVEDDGTVVKITTSTTTQPDGTKTISETREVLKVGRPAVASAVVVDYYDIPVAPAKPY